MREVVDGLKALIHVPDISVAALMRHIPGPDFPTGGTIIMSDGVQDAYLHGRGSITVRAKMHFEESLKKRASIIITELAFQTNKVGVLLALGRSFLKWFDFMFHF
jgi:DNA gyrase subunit A